MSFDQKLCGKVSIGKTKILNTALTKFVQYNQLNLNESEDLEQLKWLEIQIVRQRYNQDSLEKESNQF